MGQRIFANWASGWNQNADPPSEGLMAADPGNDCGPESISECWNWIEGTNLDANLIRAVEYASINHPGYTDIAHMQAFLANKAGIPNGLLQADPATLFDHICAWIDAGHPAIALWWGTTLQGGWTTGTGGHFSPCIGYNFDSAGNKIALLRSNTYIGQIEVVSRADFAQAIQTATNSAGQLIASAVCCNRTRDAHLGPVFA